MEGAQMDYKVELVAQALYQADPDAGLWDTEPAVRKEEFRELACNAINLLNDDIGVLLALEQYTADECVGQPL
jgi:hypothetical protein